MPLKIQNCVYTYCFEPMASVWTVHVQCTDITWQSAHKMAFSALSYQHASQEETIVYPGPKKREEDPIIVLIQTCWSTCWYTCWCPWSTCWWWARCSWALKVPNAFLCTLPWIIMGTYIYTFSKCWQYAGDTLAIRQSYASCMVDTLLNRQAYAKMSVYVVDMSDICEKYVTHALSIH